MLLRPDWCGNYPRHMCGRYASFLPAEAIARIFGKVKPLPNLSPFWNVAPTQGATVVRRHPDTAGPTHLDMLTWVCLVAPGGPARPVSLRRLTRRRRGYRVCCRTECRLRSHPLLSGRARSGFRPED
jgi:hypothetical protein